MHQGYIICEHCECTDGGKLIKCAVVIPNSGMDGFKRKGVSGHPFKL